jgi:hypothetical protein
MRAALSPRGVVRCGAACVVARGVGGGVAGAGTRGASVSTDDSAVTHARSGYHCHPRTPNGNGSPAAVSEQ